MHDSWMTERILSSSELKEAVKDVKAKMAAKQSPKGLGRVKGSMLKVTEAFPTHKR